MPRPLPGSPSLEQLRQQAKELLKAHRAGEAEAARRFQAHLPRLASLSPAAVLDTPLRLADAQFVLAREHGFPSWTRLKRHLEEGAADDGRCRLFRRELSYHEQRLDGLVGVHQSGLEGPMRQIARSHPRFAGMTLSQVWAAEFTLEDAALVYAREHGFADWDALRAHLEALACGEVEEPLADAYEAIEAVDLPRLRAVLKAYPVLVRAQGTNGHTLLHLAASLLRNCDPRPPAGGRARADEELALVRFLIEAGADVNQGSHRGWTALHQAGYSNLPALAELLLAAGADPAASAYGDGGTPLMMALFWGHREAAVYLARRGVLPRNLRAAAGLGRLDLARSFFRSDGTLTPEAGAHLGFYRPHLGFPLWQPSNDPQEILDEALVYAARNGRLQMLPFLVERGADVNGEPYNGTSLHWAAGRGRVECARWLLDHGARLEQRARYGGEGDLTPLHVAAWSGELETVRLLVEAGAALEIRDPRYHGFPWGWAEHHGYAAVCRFLLEHAARTSLFAAVALGDADQVRALLDRHPDWAKQHDGWSTPLCEAARLGRAEIAALLLERDASPHATNGDGKTPLAHALAGGHEAVAALLREGGAKEG